MNAKVVALLSHRRMPFLAAALGALLVLPSLGLGIALDDYLQRAILLGIQPYSDGTSPLLALFDFTNTPPGPIHPLEMFPWYRSPDLRIGFFRPLSSAFAMLDYALWPDNFAIQHLHSILWYAVAVLVVGLLYRKLGGGAAVAGLAGLFFAVEDSHSMPAAWLANRNSLIALVFGGLCLLLHLDWRRKGSRPALAGALVALAAGLLAGESAIAAFAYLFAYQALLDRGTLPRRMLALAPYVVVILAWRAVYSGLGFGTTGCGLYFDPAASPLKFAMYLPGRMSLLMVSQWFQAQTEPLMLLTMPLRIGAGVAAGMVTAMVGFLFWPLLKKDREARFWALGMVIALVPVSAAAVMDRNLVFAGIGAFGLLALMARETGLLGGQATIFGWRRTGTKILVFINLWLALILLPLRVLSIPYGLGAITSIARQIPMEESIRDQTLFWINGNDFFTFYTPLARRLEGIPAPRANYQLGFLTGEVRMRRTGDTSLLLRQQQGFMPRPIDMMLWSPENRFRAGQRISMPEFEAEVKEVLPDGRPRAVEFHFAKSLDSTAYVFMCLDNRIQVCRPPEIGKETILAGVWSGKR